MNNYYNIHNYLTDNIASKGIPYTWNMEDGNLRLDIPSLEFTWFISPYNISSPSTLVQMVERIGSHMGLLGEIDYEY